MAIQQLTYLDIPVEIRREQAGRARANLRTLLENPAYTQEQRTELVAQMHLIGQWEAGLLEIAGSAELADRAYGEAYGGSQRQAHRYGPEPVRTGFAAIKLT